MPDSPLLGTFLSSNPYFSAGVGVLGVGASLAILRQGLTRGMTIARRQLLVSLEIPSKDKSYAWFLHWMSKQSIRNAHQLAVETSFLQHDNGSVSANFKLVPGPGRHFFKWKGVWMQLYQLS